MALPLDIPTVAHRFTAGDLEDPIRVQWNQIVTAEASELIIDRPAPAAAVTVAGVIITAATGLYEYAWSAGDLVAGDDQLVKARLFTIAGRRKSTEFFKIDVDEDIS